MIPFGQLASRISGRLDPNALVAAAGTSCRHQIHDGSSRAAHHPVRILRDAIR